MARSSPSPADPEQTRLVRGLRRVVPMVPEFRGRRLLVRDEGRVRATPLLAVLLVLAATDVAFAADSIPSIFAVTRDAEIVFAANAMALLGLQSLFVLLEGLRDRFVHLDLGLAGVLVLTGVQMAAADLYHPPVWVTLLAIAGILGAATIASLRPTTRRRSNADLGRHPRDRRDRRPAGSAVHLRRPARAAERATGPGDLDRR
jgi:tellurite resistance protein TerC